MRGAGFANVPSMPNQPMMRVVLEHFRNNSLKPGLDFKRSFADRQGDSIGNTENMSIDGNCRRAKSNIHDHIRGFTPYSGKTLECLAAPRDFTSELLCEPFRQGDNVFCLGAVKANRSDHIPHLCLAELHQLGRIIGNGEQRTRGFVHSEISRLRREHDCNEESKRIHMLKFTFRMRIGGLKTVEYFGYLCGVWQLRRQLESFENAVRYAALT
jgi:hypothetical protein